eukprot:9586181-Alexandrium_andersonii.AAC.1
MFAAARCGDPRGDVLELHTTIACRRSRKAHYSEMLQLPGAGQIKQVRGATLEKIPCPTYPAH